MKRLPRSIRPCLISAKQLYRPPSMAPAKPGWLADRLGLAFKGLNPDDAIEESAQNASDPVAKTAGLR